MTERDQRALDRLAESMGGMSRSAALRFLIRQLPERKIDQKDIQVVIPPTRV